MKAYIACISYCPLCCARSLQLLCVPAAAAILAKRCTDRMLRIFVCPSVAPGNCSLIRLDPRSPCRSYLLTTQKVLNALKDLGSSKVVCSQHGRKGRSKPPNTVLLCCEPSVSFVQIVHLPFPTAAWFVWDPQVTSNVDSATLYSEPTEYEQRSSSSAPQNTLTLLSEDISALIRLKGEYQHTWKHWSHRLVHFAAWAARPLLPSCALPHAFYPALFNIAPICLNYCEPQASEGNLHGIQNVGELVRVVGAVASVAGGSLLAPIIVRHWPQLTHPVIHTGLEKCHGILDW